VVRHFISKLATDALISITLNDGKKIKLGRFYLRKFTYMVGMTRRLTHSTGDNEPLLISGKILNIKGQRFPLLPVLAVMHIYNEADIIKATIRHLLDQGMDIHVIDNWSNDGSFEIVKELAKKNTKITFERYPIENNNKFELGLMLSRVEEVAKQRPEYKWIMLNDADELRWSPWKDVNLQQALSFVDSLGFSAIDYTVFNFEPTIDGFNNKHDPEKFFKYGDFGKQSGNFVQVKTWKNNDKADAASSGGHHVMFPDQKIYPFKFLLNHYPVRSNKQAIEKIFKQRVSRYSEEEKKKGWHTHYDKIKKSAKFIKSKDELTLVDNKFYENYLMELISGVGLEMKD
jgi:glycosyltransferase involved in cell wall biosynthesis